jgi:hypothetical protein
MRKALLTLAAIAIVAAPTAALAKKHHRHHPVVAVAPAPDPFGPGWNIFWTGIDTVFITPWRTVFVVAAPPPVVAKY